MEAMMPEHREPHGENLPAQIGNVPAIKLTEIENEPRARDIDLGKRLGFKQPRDIRPLIEKHFNALENFGAVERRANTVTSGKGRKQEVSEYYLNEEQALYVSAKSDADNAGAVLTMLIKVFVAWRRGHLTPTPVSQGLTKYDISIIGNVVKNCTAMTIREQLGELLPQMLSNAVASIGSIVAPGVPTPIVRQGRTAGQIWNAHGFPRLRSTAWFGNRLTEMGCGIYGRGELGDNRARLFDPDKASDWIKHGGRALIDGYVKERAGQGKLEGV
jgi:hypothetical protein